MSANSNEITLFNSEHMWEIKTQDRSFTVNQKQWEEIQNAIKNQVRLVIMGDLSFNPAYIKSVTKVLKDEPKESNLPEWINENPTIQDKEKYEEMKRKVRKMLKEQNDKWQSSGRILPDEQKIKEKETSLAVALMDWERLASTIKLMSFPMPEDRRWKVSQEITTHRKDKEDHRVEYLVCNLPLPQGYEDYKNRFFIEAGDIWCPMCKAHIKKTITVFNQIEGLALSREL